ncbi:MAG TPA: AAA family ATPase [Candidatus Binatus sp.]|nr:AAA family ATPase [Candidatus Binatus sp.]
MYERFFGLVDAPFRLTPDPRYFFLSGKHADALAHLRFGLTESSGFVCITGDVGTGKTTLLRAYLGDLGPEVATAYIFNPALTPLELLQTINRELGLPAASTSQKILVDELNDHLLTQRAAGRRSVVVVDEAQALSVEALEELRLLSNLETTTEKLLRIVLVGQPQLRPLLLHPSLVQLNQRITLRWHIGPLDYPETAAYVAHRIAVASRGQVASPFTWMAVRLVHRLSGGVPRLINMIAHRALLAAFAADRRRVSARSVLRAYREIAAVPLPPRRRKASRRVAWATLAAGACAGLIVLGADRLRSGPAPWEPWLMSRTAPERPASQDGGAVAMLMVDPREAPDPVTSDTQAGAGESDPATPSPPTAALPSAEVERALAGVSRAASAEAAVDALLTAWQAPALAPNEVAVTGSLARVARQRGLEYLPVVGTASMLRVLDLPAVLELHVPGADEPRYAALTGLGGGRPVLVVAGKPTEVDGAFLDDHWFGQAHVFWRDFEALGPASLQPSARGVAVARLQALLLRAGASGVVENGTFDAATTAAVLDFQRSRLLLADGRVGRLTRIVLYGSAGIYPRPTLVTHGGTS